MAACPRCSASNPPGARFCVECGSRLEESSTADREVCKVVTTLFCDVTGSTALGERLDPESLHRVMSSFFEHMRLVIAANGGTVQKFIGDAVMAVFGIPEVHEDDAVRAVAAAMEMQRALEPLNDELDRAWRVRLQVRIGVNTGEVLVKDAGLGHALVIGDPVNVSARLEQAAEPGDVLIGRATYDFVRDAVRVEPVPWLRLKGKEAPVEAFRLVDVIAGVPGRARRLDVPFVGRQRELRLLDAAFRRAVEQRRAHLVSVVGEPGIGKSRLVAEALSVLDEQALVMAGACSEHGDGSPFAPLGPALRKASGVAQGDPPSTALARLAAVLGSSDHADLVAARVAPVLGAGGEEGTVDDTAWAIRKLLEALSAAAPLVMVLEDLHWAEPAFLDLLDHVLTWSRDAPILLLCLGRSELADQRPWWCETTATATAIRLDRLTNAESALFLERLLQGSGIADQARNRLIQVAEGNPLFVEEMLGMLVDEGLLKQAEGTWVPVVDPTDLPMPRTIESLLVARIDQLGARDSGVLQRASLVGDVFSTTALVAISSATERVAVPECLLRVARRELIRSDPAGFLGGEAFRFRHALIREAGYGMLTRQDRAVLHERFAVWLERAEDVVAVEHEELLAHHLEAAYRNRRGVGLQDDHGRALASRAAGMLAAAGRRALSREDVSTAGALLTRALGLLESDDRRRGQVLHDLGNALCRNGELPEAERALAAALEVAVAGDDDRLRAHALVSFRRLKLLTEPSAMEEAFDDASRAISQFERLGDEAGLTRAWHLVALIEWSRGRASASEEALERAVLHARAAGDEQEEAFTLGSLTSVALLGPTRVAEGLVRCEETLQLAGSGRSLEGRALRALGGLHAMQGDFESGRELVGRSIAVFEDLGQPEWMSSALQVLGMVEKLAGEHVAAERALRQSYDLLRGQGDAGHLSLAAALLAHSLEALGRLGEAEELTRVSEDLAAEEDVDTQSHWRTARAKVLSRRGDVEQARELALEAVRLGRGSELYLSADVLTDAAGILAQAGDRAGAADLVEDALALYERKGDLVSAERARAQLADVAPPPT